MNIVYLTSLIRQKDDTTFQDILSEVRFGACSKDTYKKLKELQHTKFKSGVVPTILFPKNIDVNVINEYRYDKVLQQHGSERIYKTDYANDAAKAWASACKIPESVRLCVGAQIVVTWNISQEMGIVNGTRGVVKKCTLDGPIISCIDGKEILIPYLTITNEDDKNIWFKCVPVKLAWALTIHKSQGMTLDAVMLDLGDGIFEYGQAYTALSRARDMCSVRLMNVRRESFKAHPDVLEFYVQK